MAAVESIVKNKIQNINKLNNSVKRQGWSDNIKMP